MTGVSVSLAVCVNVERHLAFAGHAYPPSPQAAFFTKEAQSALLAILRMLFKLLYCTAMV